MNVVAVLLVFIDQHDGPLSVRPFDGVGGDERVAGAIGDVRDGRKYLVEAVGLQPFVVDQLADEELRQWLVDGVIGLDGEHAEGSGRVVAAVLHLQRKVVEVIDATSPLLRNEPI